MPTVQGTLWVQPLPDHVSGTKRPARSRRRRDWELDEQTRASGRRGVERARRMLAEHDPDRPRP